MLTVNVGLIDRLVNSQLGTVKHISKNVDGEVTKICIKFDYILKLKKTILQCNVLGY